MNKHSASDLVQMQSLPLAAKIRMTKNRIQQWYEAFEGEVYVSFSGGKDSTVLKHLVDSMYSDVPSVFVNTGLEYPEIQSFVRQIKSGKYDCFNTDVEIIRPEMRFDEVLKKYGYPVVSKNHSHIIGNAQKGVKWAEKYVTGVAVDNQGRKSRYCVPKRWLPLVEAPFAVSPKCCDVMKKKPIKAYAKKTGRVGIIGTLASESHLRYKYWMKNGCNVFDAKEPLSKPMSFWTEQDVLHYIKKYNIPYASIYGDIVPTEETIRLPIFDEELDVLKTTGCDRTGCMFCMFGCHLEKEPNRFQRMKETHPKQYEYMLKPISEGGLGMKEVLDYIGVKY